MKTMIVAILVVLVSGLLGGEGVISFADQKVLRVGFDTADLGSADPGWTKGTADQSIQYWIFNGLLRLKPGDNSILETDVAERYELSRDGMEFTFHLRRGVMTHPFRGYPDGVELTSEDVVFTVQKAADPKLSDFFADFQNLIPEAVDKYTVKLKLKKRMPNPEWILVNWRGGRLLSKKAYETLGTAQFKTRPVGTGPFRVIDYIPGQKLVLGAHEKYFRGKPRLNGIEAWFMPDVNSREFGLRKGELDMISGIRSQDWIDKMKKIPKVVVDLFDPGETHVIHLNMSKKPLDHPMVRQAITYGTSREELREFIGRDVAGALYSVVPTFVPGGLTRDEVSKAGFLYETDIQKAKELLSKAGYPNGFTIKQHVSEKKAFRQAFEALQAQWKKIGIRLEMEMVDHPTYFTRMLEDTIPVVLYECMRPSADRFLFEFYYSPSIVVSGKKPLRNFSHFDLIDDMVEKAREETDREKQVQFWKKAQYKILETVPSFPLYILKFVWARSPSVKLGYELKTSQIQSPEITELTDIVR